VPVPPDWIAEFARFAERWRVATDAAETEMFLGDRPFSHFALAEHAASWSDFLGSYVSREYVYAEAADWSNASA
jgi:hypothetical protein